MIKIGIYSSDSNQKKQIKRSLKKYFNDLKMESDIRCITALSSYKVGVIYFFISKDKLLKSPIIN